METIMGAPSSSHHAHPDHSHTVPAGYAGWIGRISQIDSVLVEILYDAGAVPFVRTNVPQTLQVRVQTATSLRVPCHDTVFLTNICAVGRDV